MTERNVESFTQAIKEGSIEIVKEYLMSDDGRKFIDAEIRVGSEKWRPIHLACSIGKVDIVRLLIENNCNIECEDINKWRPIHYACRNGNFDIVRLLIENNCNIECEDKDKWRPIHWPCRNGNVEIVRLFIENNCNIECEDDNKRKPVHRACFIGNVDIVRLLIENKCNIECKDKDNQTPLDLARSRGHTECAEFIEKYLKSNSDIEKILATNKIDQLISMCDSLKVKPVKRLDSSVLETVLNRNMERIINLKTDRKMNDKELKVLSDLLNVTRSEKTKYLIKEHILYRCIKDSHLIGFNTFCCADVINGPHKIIPSTFLELAAQFGFSLFVKEIMKKTIYNEEAWNRAKLVAHQNGSLGIVASITEREFILTSRLKRNLSLLHSAVLDNDADMVIYLLKERIVDPNMNHERFGTALALAHSLCHRNCITVLQQFNVDTNTVNKFGESPLHEAIASGTHEHCRYLIERCDDIDREGFNNLTALQSAVMEGCSDLCAQLTLYGAKSNDYVHHSKDMEDLTANSLIKPYLPLTNHENALTLCLKFNRTIYPCFQQSLDRYQVNSFDGSNNSLLHLAALSLQPDICKLLLDKGALVDASNFKGNTCLLELLSIITEPITNNNIDQLINVVNILIEHGADINVKTSNGMSLFHVASKFDNEKLMTTLLSKSPNVINITEDDFILAFTKKWFEYIEMLSQLASRDLLSSFISAECIMKSFENSKPSVVKCLFDKANGKIQQSVVEDILLTTALMDNEDLFDYLIDKEIFERKLFENGESLLTNLLREKKKKYFLKLINSKNHQGYINLKNERGQLPLQVAIEIDDINIVDYLLLDTINLNNKDKLNETVLTQLLKKISICDDVMEEQKLMRLIRSVMNKGGDIHMIMSDGKYIIDSCSKPTIRNKVIKFSRDKRDYLSRENNNQKVIVETVTEKKICCICLDREIESSLQCGHTFCMTCSEEFYKCPICNREVINRTKLYFS